jgi:hypothetical protein
MSTNYAIAQRLRLIDFLVEHYGYINRATLMDYFGISTPQASKDIAEYMELAPHNLVYNMGAKRYEKTDRFARLY